MGKDGLHALIGRLGFVQVDSIRTVERAHHMILFSRNQTYRREDLQALNDLLGTAAFFGGEQPCSADASAYGVLANLLLASLETPVNRMARGFPALVAYCERMRSQFWA